MRASKEHQGAFDGIDQSSQRTSTRCSDVCTGGLCTRDGYHDEPALLLRVSHRIAVRIALSR